MADDLLRNATVDTVGTGVGVSGPCTVIVEGGSVFDSAYVKIEIDATDTDATYATTGFNGFRAVSSIDVYGQGTYFVRAVLVDAKTNTNVSVVVNQ